MKYKVLFMSKEIKILRRWMLFFIIMLFLSGLTAIPLEAQLELALKIVPYDSAVGQWLYQVNDAVEHMINHYPFLSYGYDWLAFAHFVLAILFIGPYRNPVKNKWVIEFGMIACLLIIPYALVAGHFRGIPLWWRLIDCSFGVIGMVPLLICRNLIEKVEDSIHEEEATLQTTF